jgi:hypothetical protein
MSYLQLPRLAFSGLFQADVSTVNNDPRHFDNSTFEQQFQDLQEGSNNKGWWNPVGTGIFRFQDCSVRSLVGPSGETQSTPGLDPALGLVVGNAPGRASGKLVDLDPDWQLASCLYGLGVSLALPDGRIVMQADYEANPFRDLWFARCNGAGDMGASAIFQSRLRNIVWQLDAVNSVFFDQLRAASEKDYLSIRLSTYGYNQNYGEPQFGYGTLLGAIGPALADEPRSFVLGRRFMPTTVNPAQDVASTQGIGCFSAAIDDGSATLQLDLSNALPLQKGYIVQQLPPLYLALLHSEWSAQDTTIGADDYTVLGQIDQSDALQLDQAGIQGIVIPARLRERLGQLPLALVSGPDTAGNATIEIREALLGLEVRPDVTTFRLDPSHGGVNHAVTTFHAARYGLPMADAMLAFWAAAPALDVGNTPASTPASATPKALLPVNNVPAFGVRLHPARPVTDRYGRVDVSLQGPDHMGTPREYMDGQLYTISYNFAGTDPAVQQPFDKLAVVVFSSVDACPAPAWDDVRPILQQYANLYPIMSQGLFDFSLQAQADANAFILRFVLDKREDDPDQMPVTRDLSAAKRARLVAYFDQVLATQGKRGTALGMFGNRCPTRGGAALRPQPEAQAAAPAPLPGKSRTNPG